MIVSALGKLHLAINFAPHPKIEEVMANYAESRHLSVQQRCLEYLNLKYMCQQIPNYQDIYKNVPINEDEIMMQELDLDLNFLDGIVE